ncbi:hypothetical protein HI13_contig00049-0004 [Edwardsiella piscicida]|nr:hypothetical protein HI13_contig00049-0004 [Edwardsiella piscicida]
MLTFVDIHIHADNIKLPGYVVHTVTEFTPGTGLPASPDATNNKSPNMFRPAYYGESNPTPGRITPYVEPKLILRYAALYLCWPEKILHVTQPLTDNHRKIIATMHRLSYLVIKIATNGGVFSCYRWLHMPIVA